MVVGAFSAKAAASLLPAACRRVAGFSAPKLLAARRAPKAAATPLPRRCLPAVPAGRTLLHRVYATTSSPPGPAGPTTAVADVPPTDMAPADSKPVEIFRKDYKPPSYLINTVNLNFVLNEDVSRVTAMMGLQPNYSSDNGGQPDLFLNGRDDVKLVSVAVNGVPLTPEQYNVAPKGLTIKAAALPAGRGEFELGIVTEIKPQENSLLEGLYKSGGNFCTQCEAEGFRGITFFADRPDVMAKYTTRIEADKALYPVLLSNGNLIESGELEGGRHFTVWEDPYLKPCYLFALVAGDLALTESSFTTASGRSVALRIYVQEQNQHKVDFAMEALKRSMKWDEDTFGLEYDLDLFNIVAVDDFNMGAMENKSLNIFNSRLVLATPDTATDTDFARIEGVVGHEYFHNWTGNRVTCRDWFQLTLKEGLTVYRDQEFSADMSSRPVKRIEDVIRLRAAQLPEDAGPLAHPVRPDSYIKMDNFYTSTVYEKGAEVVRMYEAVLGKQGFRKGMDLYFKRHDGHAVTCDDFLAAMADANSEDLSALARWYSQAGTPELTVSTEHNPSDKTYTIRTKQRTPATPGQASKQPVLIPVRLGLLGPDGAELPLRLRGSGQDLGTESVLRVTEAEQEFVFEGVESRPVPSLLRSYSAPVKMHVEGQRDEDLVFLLAHDTDAYNRWEAGQILAKNLMVRLYEAAANQANGPTLRERMGAAGGLQPALVDAFRAVLEDSTLDGSFKAMAINLPADSEVIDAVPGQADPVTVHEVREYVASEMAQRLRPQLEAAVKANDAPAGEQYVYSAAACGRRAIKNKALAYLSHLGDPTITEQLLHRLRSATNMTDEIAALACLDRAGGEARQTALAEFYNKWQKEPLVILKWITIQAMSNAPGNVTAVKALLEHPAFNISNPNNCYSLFLAFARSPANFHAGDGTGYEFLADSVLQVDKINRQVASRIVSTFSSWRHYDSERQSMIKKQLERIMHTDGLSDNVYEIAYKALHAE